MKQVFIKKVVTAAPVNEKKTMAKDAYLKKKQDKHRDRKKRESYVEQPS